MVCSSASNGWSGNSWASCGFSEPCASETALQMDDRTSPAEPSDDAQCCAGRALPGSAVLRRSSKMSPILHSAAKSATSASFFAFLHFALSCTLGVGGDDDETAPPLSGAAAQATASACMAAAPAAVRGTPMRGGPSCGCSSSSAAWPEAPPPIGSILREVSIQPRASTASLTPRARVCGHARTQGSSSSSSSACAKAKPSRSLSHKRLIRRSFSMSRVLASASSAPK
mmetsp:Transcript_24268/g.68858  ORF Transcript_24268/g.68858 Transcript_24268/m.68858 type:complete len:228 (-) Transcript_24268:749-1432(-)